MNPLREKLVKSYNEALVALTSISEQLGLEAQGKFRRAEEIFEMEDLVSATIALNSFVIKKQQEVLKSNSIDRTTLLGNRDSFLVAKSKVSVADIENGSLVAIHIDINDLKLLNDENGHKAGDEYLATLGKAIKQNIRQTDRAYRVGGDEFVIIMQSFEHEAARKVRDIQTTFKALWANKYKVEGSFAYGIASGRVSEKGPMSEIEAELKTNLKSAKTPVEKFDAIIHAADSRMYVQKQEIKKQRKHVTFKENMKIEAAQNKNPIARRILDNMEADEHRRNSQYWNINSDDYKDLDSHR